jgi:serine protease Do
LGIQLDVSTTDPRVTRVFEDSAAEAAGVRVNDLIVEINEIATPTREKLFRTIGEFGPGDTLALQVERAGDKLSLQAVLTPPVKGMGIDDRSRFQNNLGSELSNRRFGFDSAFQHDTVLKPTDCGGPLVDLEGRVVGFNIARSGRTESYAIPANVAMGQFYDLMAGNLAPAEGLITTSTPAADDETTVAEPAAAQ